MSTIAVIVISMYMSLAVGMLSVSLNKNSEPMSARSIVMNTSIPYSNVTIANPVDFLMLHRLFSRMAFAGRYSFDGVMR